MEIITITEENLETEHICCAISNNKDCQVMSKKQWLADRLKDGLMFKKGDVRGKCFIEYIPAEYAWVPIEAEDLMYVNCFWIAGQYKGKGYSNKLLEACIQDSRDKGKKGLVILSSSKKRAFLSDPGYLKYKGFLKADDAAPYFELWYLPFEKAVKKPGFKECVKIKGCSENGLVLYYTNQCPFTAKYVPLLKEVADTNKVNLKINHITTAEQAQNAPCPFTSFSLFLDGELVTHEILSEKKFQKILDKRKIK